MSALAKDVYVEVAITGQDKESLVASAKNFFLMQRINPGEIAFSQNKKRFKSCIYLRSLSQLKKIEERFSKDSLKGLKLSSKLLEPRDWRDKWMHDYHIQNLCSKFVLVPNWEKKKYKVSKRKPIFLDPKSAFGSGTHETTRLVIKHMESFENKVDDFFDVGVGTGVLSVAAYQLGAKTITGLDHDPESVKVARANLKANGFLKPKFSSKDLKHLKLAKKFDLVCANVLSGVLIKHRIKIAFLVSKRGALIVSGILKRNEKEFLTQFQHKQLRLQKVLRGRRWCAVLYKKR